MLFKASFSGQTIQSSRVELANLLSRNKPIPEHFEKANSLTVPLGPSPSRGWVFLTRSGLSQLNLDSNQTLTFDFTNRKDVRTVLTFNGLVITQEPLECIPSYEDTAEDALYLVEFSDLSWLVCNPHFGVPIAKWYNVRAGAYLGSGTTAEYLSGSLNAGSLWTWQTMVSDIWTLMSGQIGSAPTLPYTPAGTPEGFKFPGMSAWEALTCVLNRIGCAVKRNLTAAVGSQFSIVKIGDADATAATAIASVNPIHDGRYLSVTRGRLPEKFRLYAHRQEKFPAIQQANRNDSSTWETNALYSVDVVGPPTTAETGTYGIGFSDLPAIYDETGTITNAAALSTLATELADNFYDGILERLWYRFSGLLGISAGSTLKSVRWRERHDAEDGHDGVITEVLSGPEFVRIDDDGKITECQSTRLQSPFLGPSWPGESVEPAQVLEIANGTISSGRYDSTLEKRDPVTPTWLDKESIWGLDLAGATSLTAGARYPCVLVSYESSRPVYAFDSTSRGWITGITVAEVDGSPSYTGITTIQIDQADGFVLTQPGAGIVRIDQTPASSTTVGYVTIAAQTFAGAKTFLGATVATSTSINGDVVKVGLSAGGTTGTVWLNYLDAGDSSGHYVALDAAGSGNNFRVRVFDVSPGPTSQLDAFFELSGNSPTSAGSAYFSTYDGPPKIILANHGTSPATYTGATGTDGLSNVFVGGICTFVSAGSFTGTGNIVKANAPTLTTVTINAGADNQIALTLNAFSGSQTADLLDADGSGISGLGYFKTTKTSAPTIPSGPAIYGPYLG